jgi:hypothetical protein
VRGHVSPGLSALVVLRPAGGRALTGDEVITSETVAEFLPAPDDAERVRAYFRDLGYDVGPLVAMSFSITGPGPRFEETFGAQPDVGELPLDRLPPEVSGAVQAVTFPPPPDFGPTSP